MFVMGVILLAVLGAALALSAESRRAQRHPDRLSDGAARLRRDVRHDVRRPPDHEGRSAHVDDGAAQRLLIWSLWDMTGWTPSIGSTTLSSVTFVQGVGMGLVFVPMNMVAFATLAPQLRTDGAGVDRT